MDPAPEIVVPTWQQCTCQSEDPSSPNAGVDYLQVLEKSNENGI
jgi:hypothetical protein